MYSRIAGVGAYFPSTVWSSAYVGGLIGEDAEWIVSRTGIRQRFISADDEFVSDMAYNASLQALLAANVAPADIELVIVAATIPDVWLPSTACILQDKLGIKGAPAFDMQATCAGFVYALTIADRFIRAGVYKNALIVGADAITKFSKHSVHKEILILPSDAAGAVVLVGGDLPGVIDTHIGADGSKRSIMYSDNGLVDRHARVDMEMDGRRLFKDAVSTMSAEVRFMLDRNQLSEADIDWVIPHQANKRIIDGVTSRSKVAPSKVIVTVDSHGNTSAASIPLALHTAMSDGRVKPGDLCILVSYGAGAVWGSALVRI